MGLLSKKINLGFVNDLIRSRVEYLPIKKKLYVGFGAILAFMTVIVVVTVIGLLLVRNHINSVVDDHQPTVFASAKLAQHIKDASGSLGLYLLGKEELHQNNYRQALGKIESTLQKLEQQEPIQADSESHLLVKAIEKNIEKFKEYEGKFFEFARSDVANFPGILYASENLNPLSRDILNHLNAMIMSEETEP
ncbi:MAG: MCP four helix bundle domain-containing protein, partial [Thioalkalispiraceae bacterium]